MKIYNYGNDYAAQTRKPNVEPQKTTTDVDDPVETRVRDCAGEETETTPEITQKEEAEQKEEKAEKPKRKKK